MIDWESHSLLCDTCVTGEKTAVGVAGGIFGDGVAELAPMFAWICAVELLNEESRFCAEDFLRMPGRLTSTTLVRFMIAVWVDRGQPKLFDLNLDDYDGPFHHRRRALHCYLL
jgi:hypothetical protein